MEFAILFVQLYLIFTVVLTIKRGFFYLKYFFTRLVELENNPLSHLNKISLQRLARFSHWRLQPHSTSRYTFKLLGQTEEAARTSLAYTNNEINLERNHETCMCFSSVVGGQHVKKLTTSPFAPKILF